jgi:hypothetical protein
MTGSVSLVRILMHVCLLLWHPKQLDGRTGRFQTNSFSDDAFRDGRSERAINVHTNVGKTSGRYLLLRYAMGISISAGLKKEREK